MLHIFENSYLLLWSIGKKKIRFDNSDLNLFHIFGRSHHEKFPRTDLFGENFYTFKENLFFLQHIRTEFYFQRVRFP